MTIGIESITTASLALALDAASLRHQGIAQNIANANTEGYVPVALSFEDQLEQARRSLREHGRVDPFALTGIRPQLQPVAGVDGQGVRVQLDTEMARLAQNAVHFQALTKGLSRHLAIMSSAVSDGKK
jgi:flagellar basal-body rod protein FlgB